jgi:hypothetical protein
MFPFLLLIGGALLMLVGCDQMLDAIYHPSNQIKVTVEVNITTHPDFNMGYVNLQLSGPGVSLVSRGTYNSSDSQYAYYYFTFSKLPDGNYNISATYYGKTSPSSSGYANNITMPDFSPSNPDTTGRSVVITISIT